MPSETPVKTAEFAPDLYPPFPEDQSKYPQANIPKISLAGLQARDTAAEDSLFAACTDRGIFYLDLRGSKIGEETIRDADEVCRVAERTFGLPPEEKIKYRPNPPLQWGYKNAGTTFVDKERTKDSAEFFNLPRVDMMAPEGAEFVHKWPETILEKRKLIGNYFRNTHAANMMVMSALARKLGIDPDEILNRHRIEVLAGGDHLRLIRGPPRLSPELPEIQTPTHTDNTTITHLMNWLGGLQMWSKITDSEDIFIPDTPGEWQWIKPEPGCATIVLGDAAVRYTHGALKSCRHRVVPAPADQGKWPRYSLVSFTRSEDDAIIETLKGEGVPPTTEKLEDEGMTAKKWHLMVSMKLREKYLKA